VKRPIVDSGDARPLCGSADPGRQRAEIAGDSFAKQDPLPNRPPPADAKPDPGVPGGDPAEPPVELGAGFRRLLGRGRPG
jgi:hypothetical protein